VWAEQPGWLWSLSRCIRNHESINVGHYQAENPVSTAAGAYQYIQSTWDGNARWAKWNGRYVARKYVGKPASHAPAWVQDVVFIHTISRGGIKAWNGTGCPGT
jgi:muramidase (phage lysozyme)